MNILHEDTFKSDSKIDLVRASLNISQYIKYPDLDIESYIEKLSLMADEIRSRMSSGADCIDTVNTINHYLYADMGFAGNRNEYYDPRNSFLNDVIDTRRGIPISMSIIYSYIANELGVETRGVCFPGHFIIRTVNERGELIIDPYNEGKILTRDDCQSILDNLFGGKVILEERFLEFADNYQILKRVINNLKNIYVSAKDYDNALKTVNLLLILDPEDTDQLRDRALICINLECYSQSLEDLENYFSKINPDTQDEELRSYIPVLKNIVANLN